MKYIAFAVLLALCACASYRDADVPLVVADEFDASEYLGRWYEIASFPTPFQKGCTQTQAVYMELAASDLIGIVNTCQKSGNTSRIEGSAEIVGPAKFRIKLNGVPVAAPYWVLWVDSGYETAVVGVPSGSAGWVLSRTPALSAAKLNAARDVLARNGYDLDELRMTPQ